MRSERHDISDFTLLLAAVERPYDPRPYDSRYSRDHDDRRGGGGGRSRYDDHRGGGRDYDRPHKDYDRGGDRERGGYAGRDYDRGGDRGERGGRGYDDRRY